MDYVLFCDILFVVQWLSVRYYFVFKRWWTLWTFKGYSGNLWQRLLCM